jgi:hypothetical protein
MRSACALVVGLFAGGAAAQVVEIPAMTVDHAWIDMDRVGPPGPTTVAAINAAGSPGPADILRITLTAPTSAPGIYDTQTQRGNALGGDPAGSLGLHIIGVGGQFGSFGAMILDLGSLSTQFGFSIGDWSGPANVIVRRGGNEVGRLTGISFSGSPNPRFVESREEFDQVEVTLLPNFGVGNWVVPDLYIQTSGGGVCYPDCDNSGTLDFFDFLCFQNSFLAGDPYADCDQYGVLDFFDFLCFQNEFLAGCP